MNLPADRSVEPAGQHRQYPNKLHFDRACTFPSLENSSPPDCTTNGGDVDAAMLEESVILTGNQHRLGDPRRRTRGVAGSVRSQLVNGAAKLLPLSRHQAPSNTTNDLAQKNHFAPLGSPTTSG